MIQEDVRDLPKYTPYQPGPLTRAFDGALSVFAPRRALQNALAREKRHAFGYEGARITRARKNATRAGTITSNTPQNTSDRLQLVWEARDLAMNDPFIHGLLDKFAHYVVGPRFRFEALTGNRNDDAMLQDYLEECLEDCDYTKRSKFTDLARLTVMGILRDGDMGYCYHEEPDAALSMIAGKPQTRLLLQAIESDVIGGYHYWIEPGCVAGVEYDEQTGRVLGYRIYPRNNFGYYRSDYTLVPANCFTFLSYRQRVDEYRGVTPLAAAIPTARDIKEILENEKFGVKWMNSWAGFITTAPGDANASDPSSIFSATVPTPFLGPAGGQGTTTRYYEQFEPGMIGHLGIGEEVKSAATDRPSPAFNGFLALLYRQVCAAVGMPFGFAFDASGLQGTVARLESQQAKRTFEAWQAYMDENFYQPLFRRFIAHGIVQGRLRFEQLTRLPRIVVSFPAYPTVDVGRESRANVMEYESGLGSFSRICVEQGINPREEIERMANDAAQKIETAKRKGIPVELLMPKLGQVSGGGRSSGSGSGGGGAGGGEAP